MALLRPPDSGQLAHGAPRHNRVLCSHGTFAIGTEKGAGALWARAASAPSRPCTGAQRQPGTRTATEAGHRASLLRWSRTSHVATATPGICGKDKKQSPHAARPACWHCAAILLPKPTPLPHPVACYCHCRVWALLCQTKVTQISPLVPSIPSHPILSHQQQECVGLRQHKHPTARWCRSGWPRSPSAQWCHAGSPPPWQLPPPYQAVMAGWVCSSPAPCPGVAQRCVAAGLAAREWQGGEGRVLCELGPAPRCT